MHSKLLWMAAAFAAAGFYRFCNHSALWNVFHEQTSAFWKETPRHTACRSIECASRSHLSDIEAEEFWVALMAFHELGMHFLTTTQGPMSPSVPSSPIVNTDHNL